MNEQSTISSLKGIGEKTEKLFPKIKYFLRLEICFDIFRKDMKCMRKQPPIAEIDEGRTVTVTGAIYGKVQVSGRTSMQVTTIYVKDVTGTLRVVWFRMPFFAKYVSKRGCGHTTWKSRAAKRNTSYGTAGNFLSKCVV